MYIVGDIMDYKTSLRKKVSDRIKALLDLQNIDVEIIKTFNAKKEKASEWNRLHKESNDISKELEKTRKSISELDTAINNKHAEIENISEEVREASDAQSKSKKVKEYNIYQQKIVEARKKEKLLENSIDNIQDKKQNLEERLESLENKLESFYGEFTAKSKSIQSNILQLNKEGRSLMKSRESERKTIKDKIDIDLLLKYENLIKKMGNKVIVPIDGQSCYGCNIMLTNNDIGVVKKGFAISTCEHCSRMLYFASQEEAGDKKQVKKRKVFLASSSLNI